MTLFAHVVSGLESNYEMNQLDSWFDGVSDASEVIDIYSQSFDEECDSEEMAATIDALNEMIAGNVDNISSEAAQAAIKEWNERVWGQDFGDENGSVPFSG